MNRTSKFDNSQQAVSRLLFWLWRHSVSDCRVVFQESTARSPLHKNRAKRLCSDLKYAFGRTRLSYTEHVNRNDRVVVNQKQKSFELTLSSLLLSFDCMDTAHNCEWVCRRSVSSSVNVLGNKGSRGHSSWRSRHTWHRPHASIKYFKKMNAWCTTNIRSLI